MNAPYLLRAFGGGPLVGDRIVRQVYLDESGTGDPAREPEVVICAVVVNPDKQWRALREYLGAMADEFVPADKRHLFKGFHGTELYSGGAIFERDPNVLGKWWPVLDELVTIPKQFDLPVIFGHIRRDIFEAGKPDAFRSGKGFLKPVLAAQVVAFGGACKGIEHWMNGAAAPDEVADMIMENNNETQALIHVAQRLITDPEERKQLDEKVRQILTVNRVMWPINFQPKEKTSLLQLADICAWAVRRRLAGDTESDRFYDPLRPQIINTINNLPPVAIRPPRVSARPS